jgi:NAD-dependent deacetylase
MDKDKEAALARLRGARSVTVLTGSGVSAASGIPTFRGPDGLWRNFRVEELASAAGFTRNPRAVWEWYAWRRGLIASARPNRAHHILAGWGRRFPAFSLITQNVDGLHESMGTEGVIRLHGSIWEMRCWRGCGAYPWEDRTVPLHSLPPLCPRCGDLARPGVVWFGEPLPEGAWEAAVGATACDVFLSIGTSSQVHPASGLAWLAGSKGACTIELNQEATLASDSFDVVLGGDLQAVLEELEAALDPV